MPDPESLSHSLKRYLRVLRRQWWVVTIVTALAIVAALTYIVTATPVYSASMKVVVGQGETLFAPGLSVNVQPFTQTITDLLRSQVVAERTISELGLHTTPSKLLSNLSVSSGAETSVIDVSYHDTNRPRAVIVLSRLGTTFTGMVNHALAGRTGTSTASGQIASQPVSVVIFDPAHADPGRVSPRTAPTLLIAILVGLVAGLLLAFLRDALSSHIRNQDEAEDAYHAPVLGTLPRGALGLGIGQVSSLPPKLSVRLAGAFRLLTTSLRYSTNVQRGVIVVAGARPEDGKTTVAAHVAAVLAAAGNNVIAVEADLHRPALHRLLAVAPGNPGVRDVVSGATALPRALVNVEFGELTVTSDLARYPAVVGGSDTPGGERDLSSDPIAAPGSSESIGAARSAEQLPEGEFPIRTQAEGSLRLLPAGVAPENPLNVLSLGNVSSLVSRLRTLCDYVVIDTPPLLLSGDAYPIVQLADAVLVVCREQVTTVDEARRTRAVLESVGVPEFSVVLSESVSSAHSPYYGYAEGY